MNLPRNFRRWNVLRAILISLLCWVSASQALTLTGVQSRKVHGSAGPLDLAIDTGKSVSGAVTVEPRAIGTGHVVVFQFDQAVTLGPAHSLDLTGESGVTLVGQPGIGISVSLVPGAANEVAATLTGISDNRRVTVVLNDIRGADMNALNVRASIGFLLGDTNGSRTVDSADTTRVKARSGQNVTLAGREFDLNASGFVSATDVVAVKAAGIKTLVPGNTAPVVNAGGNQNLIFPATVTLNGAASDDGFPNPPGALNLTWTTAAGPAVTFGNASAAQTTATLPQAGVYTLRLTASDGQLSASADAVITASSNAAASATLSFPGSVTAGVAGSLTVTLRDAQNNIAASYAGSVHFTSDDPQAQLPADYTFTGADGGVHTFAGVALRTAGSRTLTATFTGGPGPAGASTSVAPAAPVVLTFLQQPAGGNVRASLAPPVSVAINDAFGNRTSATNVVSLALASNPGNAILGGTTSRSAVAGLASFTDLSFTNEGAAMTLQASAAGLASATSAPFNIIDNIAPGTTSLLVDAGLETQSSLALSWDASGDDGFLGVASSYTLKVHTAPINALNFSSVGSAVPVGAPQAPGAIESAVVNGLDANTTYYFGLRIDDGAGNRSFAFTTGTTLACDSGYSGTTCSQCADGFVSSGPLCIPICAAANPCTMPPPASCSSATTLSSFTNPGTCSAAVSAPFYTCSYSPVLTDCAGLGLVCSLTGGPAACRVN